MQLRELTTELVERFKKVKIFEKSEAEFLATIPLGRRRRDAYLPIELSKRDVGKIMRLAKKRESGMPLDLVLGNMNFYGRDFIVSKSCLCPRPETELLVQWAGQNCSSSSKTLDLCSGSGAIGITLALEFGYNDVTLSDKSKRALKIAEKNASALGANITLVHSDLFKTVQGKFDVVVCNPPYISKKEYEDLQNEVKNYEPKMALVAGETGLEFYEKIIKQLPAHLNKNGKIFFEVGSGQAKSVAKMLEKDFENIEIKQDDSKIERMVCGTIREKI
ncbi:MAG: peptide chain release factor N(5)-glutamine methyltransferase [Clostridia bacterium]|nr:peptide chain release factor N(5)-glutamine methyltransferase [Clostridia bacterium]